MNTNKRTILLISLTIVLSVAVIYLLLNREQEKINTDTNISESDIAIGKPCSYNDNQDSATLDTKGLQCYFYGEADPQKNIQPGIWIKPDLKFISLGAPEDYLFNWKKYESPDKKITFNYPSIWSVNGQNWPDNEISIGTGEPVESFISIQKIEKNSISIDDIIQTEKKNNSTVLESLLNLNGADTIRLDVAPTNNLSSEIIYLFIDKGDYYISIIAPRDSDPLFGFPINYFLSTFKVE